MLKKLGLLHYLALLAVVLAIALISLIVFRVPGLSRTALVPPTPSPSPAPTATPIPTAIPVPVEALANLVVPDSSQPRGFHFALDQSGDPPLTEFRALVNYGADSAAERQVDGESPQVVIGSYIYLYGDWKRQWEKVLIDLTGPDGTDLGTYHIDDEVQAGDYGPLPRTRLDLTIDIPIGSPTGTYTASVRWNNGTTTTFSFDVTQPYAPFVRLMCENNDRFNILLLGFEPNEEVRLAAYDLRHHHPDTKTSTYNLQGEWTVTAGSDGSLFSVFPEEIEIEGGALIMAIGKSRPVTMTDNAGKTLQVTGYDKESCLVDQP